MGKVATSCTGMRLLLSVQVPIAFATVELHTINCNAVSNIWEEGAAWERAIPLLAGMGKTLAEQHGISYNAAISACHTGGEWQRPLALLTVISWSAFELDAIGYSAAFRAQGAEWQSSRLLLVAMHRATLKSDASNYSATNHACDEGRLIAEDVWPRRGQESLQIRQN